MYQLELIPVEDHLFQGLQLTDCGRQKCDGPYETGPGIREHYSLHMIMRGRGSFRAQGQAWNLGAGEGFLICPGQVISYQADEKQPWEYIFVSFRGPDASALVAAARLGGEELVFRAENSAATQDAMLRYLALARADGGVLSLHGALMDILASLTPAVAPGGRLGGEYFGAAVAFIQKSYPYPLTVEDIARHTGVDRTYLFRLFKQAVGLSPQAYLRDYRLKKARELLRDTHLTLEQVAGSTGLTSASHLSKAFRQAFGCSPGALRRRSERSPRKEGTL